MILQNLLVFFMNYLPYIWRSGSNLTRKSTSYRFTLASHVYPWSLKGVGTGAPTIQNLVKCVVSHPAWATPDSAPVTVKFSMEELCGYGRGGNRSLKYFKIGQIWFFWLRKHDAVHRSKWNLICKSIQLLYSSILNFPIIGEGVDGYMGWRLGVVVGGLV